ncbi:hypothetical protein [Phaeospirillum tilakii]|uniref:Uncharacterized protein n=1 Tax=Phaeospirillum tilakii TaxID=741673 RepID=A0ABW5CA11_9PROT
MRQRTSRAQAAAVEDTSSRMAVITTVALSLALAWFSLLAG